MFVKEKKSDIAVLIILAASIMILLYMITQLGQIVSFINSIAIKANIDIVKKSEKEITNVDILRRLSQLEKYVYDKDE